jgi:hypothetical protein
MRIEKTSNYTVMSNYHFKEKNMTLKSKGLLSLMLSLPDNWDYSVGGLCSLCKENLSAIKSALKELREFGYLTMTKHHCDGRYEWEYVIHEYPVTNKNDEEIEFNENEIQEDKLQQIENQPIENHAIYKDTNKLNTKKTYICSPDDEHDRDDNNQQLEDFEKIYAIYPKKVGKAKAFAHYKNYISKKGKDVSGVRYRLTNKQIYLAVAAYVNEKESSDTDLQYYKNFDTFMNVSIVDYLER